MDTLKWFFVLVVLGLVTMAAADECSPSKDCNTCVKVSTCVWCSGDTVCIPGTVTGPSDGNLCPSKQWKYGQCSADGQTLVWIGLGVGGAVILVVTFVVWYFCCCKRNKKKEQALLDDYEKKFEEKPKKFQSSKWQEKRSEMNAKYGWGPKDDEE